MTHAATCLTPSGSGNGPTGSLPTAQCRIPGCPATIGRLRLMCRPHWYQVPKHLRDLIWANWRSGVGIFDPVYRQAAAEAIAAVQAAAARKDPQP